MAQAGRLGAVTISTNMAGRGTDIRLGGSDGADEERVVALGGLYIIGTNRHESRRVDDQLRGRAGRQGDPGSSRFFVSLEDDLLKNIGIDDFIPAKHRSARQWGPIDDPAIRRTIARAQRIVEMRNFDVRQALWFYSYLVEQQRCIVYERRQRILMREVRPEVLLKRVPEGYEKLCSLIGEESAVELERLLMLQATDHCWADHLAAVDDIQDGIHLAAVGGLSPLEEFQKAVAQSFEDFFTAVDDWVIEKFAALPFTATGLDLAAAGLQGHSSTWTYLVADMVRDPIVAMLKRRATSIWF